MSLMSDVNTSSQASSYMHNPFTIHSGFFFIIYKVKNVCKERHAMHMSSSLVGSS